MFCSWLLIPLTQELTRSHLNQPQPHWKVFHLYLVEQWFKMAAFLSVYPCYSADLAMWIIMSCNYLSSQLKLWNLLTSSFCLTQTQSCILYSPQQYFCRGMYLAQYTICNKTMATVWSDITCCRALTKKSTSRLVDYTNPSRHSPGGVD